MNAFSKVFQLVIALAALSAKGARAEEILNRRETYRCFDHGEPGRWVQFSLGFRDGPDPRVTKLVSYTELQTGERLKVQDYSERTGFKQTTDMKINGLSGEATIEMHLKIGPQNSPWLMLTGTVVEAIGEGPVPRILPITCVYIGAGE